MKNNETQSAQFFMHLELNFDILCFNAFICAWRRAQLVIK